MQKCRDIRRIKLLEKINDIDCSKGDQKFSDIEGDTKENSYYLFDDSDNDSEEENIRRRQKRMS